MCCAWFFWELCHMHRPYTGGGNPQPIPVTGTGGFPCVGGPTESVANVPLTGNIGTDYVLTSVSVDLTHTFNADIEMDLISPSGTVWDLSSDNGGAGDNFTMTVFMDGAPNITTGAAPFTGTFEAEQGPFATGFAGESVNGNWTLSICDDAGGDSGQLLSFSITFTEISCEFVGLPGDITLSAEAAVCGANVTLPIPSLTGMSCAGIPDPNSIVNLGPVTENLNIAPFNPGQTTLGVTNFTIGGAVANAPAGTMVSITGNWNSDNSFGTENPTFSLEGTLIGNLTTGGADCQANDFEYMISAADYNAAAADGNLDFTVGADIDVNSFCAVDEITVALSYASSTLPFANNYNGTQNASDFYPVGTTEVCFFTGLSVGGQVEECFNITVIDDQGPIFMNCLKDQTISLDAGECTFTFNYEPIAMDNCPATAFGIANQDTTNAANFAPGIACSTFGSPFIAVENRYFQAFDIASFGIASDWEVSSVSVAISTINVGLGSIVGNVYTLSNTSTPYDVSSTNRTLIATTGAPVLGGAPGSFQNIPLTSSVTVPAGSVLLLEIIEDFPFTVGKNPTGGGTDTWLGATACGIDPNNPQTFAAVGFPNELTASIVGSLMGADIVQTMGPVSGTALPIGTTSYEYIATDAAGNTTVCAFNVVVEEFAPIRGSLNCNSGVNISLSADDCTATVGADDILEGGNYGCYDSRYTVIIDRNGDGLYMASEGADLDGSDVGNTYNVQVSDNVTGNKCWGSIVVEDKNIPGLVCEDLTLRCDADLTPGSPISASTSASVSTGDNWGSTGNFDQELTVGGVPSSAVVTDVNIAVDITHTWVGDLDIDVISPSGTTVRILDGQCGNTDDVDAIFDDEGAALVCVGTPVISGNVIPDNALSAFDGEPVAGEWIVRVTDNVAGDGGTINNVAVIIEYDAELEFPFGDGVTTSLNPDGTYTVTGFDPCGPATLVVDDNVIMPNASGCTDKRVERTYTITDGAGNSSTCTQTIDIEPITLADLDLPPNFDGVENPALLCQNVCGGDVEVGDDRFCGPENLYWSVLPNGHPSPDNSKNWNCGAVKCFGTGRPGNLCANINATYEDVRIDI